MDDQRVKELVEHLQARIDWIRTHSQVNSEEEFYMEAIQYAIHCVEAFYYNSDHIPPIEGYDD